MATTPTIPEAPPLKSSIAKVVEIRASIYEGTLDAQGKPQHTKHVALEITDPAVCSDIATLLGQAIAKEHGEMELEDATKLELTGKAK